MALLPKVLDMHSYGRLLARLEVWSAAIDAIVARHGLSEVFTRTTEGSTVVYLSPSWCIKLYPPLSDYLDSHRLEVASLDLLAGRLPIATPRIVAEGELEGWPYCVTTRLPGQPVDELWAGLPQTARLQIARELGEAIRVLHNIEVDGITQLPGDWEAFAASRRSDCLQRERDKSLGPHWLPLLELYLSEVDGVQRPMSRPAILHTEIGPGHCLVEQDHVIGLIDFGETMIGDPEYDVATVGLFVTGGDARAFREFSVAYGCTARDLADPHRPSRLMRHALLHRYGSLAWYLEKLKPPAMGLSELANYWFGVG